MALLKSIATLSGLTMLSRLIGFVRDILIAQFLGATLFADAFFVAWRFPNLFRSLFAEGTLNVSFVPVFDQVLKEKGDDKARVFATEAFSVLFYVLLAFTVVVELAMPYIMDVFAPGFRDVPDKLVVTTQLSRITFPFLMSVSLVSLFACILNAFNKFAAAAFSPCLLNLTMIASLLGFASYFSNPAYALAWGVFAAGIVEFIWLLYHIYRLGFMVHLMSPVRAFVNFSSELKTLFKRMLPGVLGSGVYQINLFLDTFFATFVGGGALSWLSYAHHLFQLPIGIIGVAIGTALLPVLSHHIHTGHAEKAQYEFNRGLEIAFLMSLPCMIGLYVLAEPIITILFERGAFKATSTLPTAYALKAFSIGLPAYMLTKALAPFFYAQGDTKTPVRIAAIGVAINAVLCFTLMQFWGHIGIALATGITVWINAGQYVVLLRKKISLDTCCKKRLYKIAVASIVMCAALLVAQQELFAHSPNWLHISTIRSGLWLLALIAGSAGVYGACLLLTKAFSLNDFTQIFKREKI